MVEHPRVKSTAIVNVCISARIASRRPFNIQERTMKPPIIAALGDGQIMIVEADDDQLTY